MTDTDRAKEYLGRIQKSDRLIRRLMGTVATLRRSLTGQNYELNPNKVQSTVGKNPLEETVGKIVDLEAEIDQYIDELIEQRADALTRLKSIPDQNHQSVLVARYVNGERWEKIAIDFNFSVAQIYRIHRDALLDFVKKNPDIF